MARLGSLEILARYLVDEDVFFRNVLFLHGQALAAFILVYAGDPDIPIRFSHDAYSLT